MTNARGPGISLFYPRKHRLLFWLGTGGGIAAALATWADRAMPLNWKGSPLAGPVMTTAFGSIYLLFIVTALVVAVLFIAALARLGRGERDERLALWIPLLSCALSVAAFLLIPSNLGYERNSQAYDEAIGLIESRDFPAGGQEVKLPPELQRLSMTGSVLAVRKDGILQAFFLQSEAQGQYQQWLVYFGADRAPRQEDLIQTEGIDTRIDEIEAHWYNVFFFQAQEKAAPEEPSIPGESTEAP